MYVDESGDSGLPSDGSPTRYFCLSGLVVHELRWQGGAYFRRLDPILCKVASISDPLGIVRL